MKNKTKNESKKKECKHVFTYLSEGVIMCDKCGYATSGEPNDDSRSWPNGC